MRFGFEVQKIKLGTSRNLPATSFSSWEIIYDHAYSHKCSTKELLSLKSEWKIQENDVVSIAAFENDKVLLCGTDEFRNVFRLTSETNKALKSDL